MQLKETPTKICNTNIDLTFSTNYFLADSIPAYIEQIRKMLQYTLELN